MGLETGVRIGRYEIGRKLGQGGFGILYAARDHELGRDIAIKFLRPEHAFKPTVVQRFLQEARAAARITHPGIVTVYDSGEVNGTNTRADGTVFIAMELLAGQTLAQRLRQSGTMPYRMALGFCRQLATALAAAHAAGIVHRDLKPQNIFLVPDPAVLGGERIKILDFGVAKLADEMGSAVATHSMLMLGTPMYMSPEQCRSSAKVDARSDIYSLGCILFEMVCGRTPFDGDTGELIAKHQLVPPPRAHELNPAVPVVLDQLITSMLAKHPDDRPQTMAAVLDVLEECDGRSVEPLSRPDHAALPPAPPATPRHSQLRRVATAAAALALLGIAIGWCAARDDKPSARAAAVREPVSVASATSIDAAAKVDQAKDLKLACLEAQVEKRWSDLKECGQKLAAISTDEGGKFIVLAEAEIDNEAALTRLEDAVHDSDMAAAKAALDEIESESVFYGIAQSLYASAQPDAVTEKPVPPPVPSEKKCDADRFRDEGIAFVRAGKHVQAIGAFEASLECQRDQFVEKLAFVAACHAKHEDKARAHYKKLTPAQREEVLNVCTRNKIMFAEACDADALKEQAIEHINLAQHAAALATLEASLRCRRDPYVMQLAFMEACASSNSAKAKVYFKQLTPAQQAKFAQLCTRNKVPYE